MRINQKFKVDPNKDSHIREELLRVQYELQNSGKHKHVHTIIDTISMLNAYMEEYIKLKLIVDAIIASEEALEAAQIGDDDPSLWFIAAQADKKLDALVKIYREVKQ